jgi:hypothetical protein
MTLGFILCQANQALQFTGGNDLLKVIIPATVAISIFFFGVLVTWIKANIEKRRDTRNLRNVVITWIPLIKNPIIILMASCKDFSDRIKKTNEIHPEHFKFNFLYASKISSIELTKSIKAFVTNSTDDQRRSNENFFKLISGLEFLAKVEDEIKAKYDEHYKYSLDLLDKWNVNFIKFDNLQISLMTSTVDKTTERVELEKELNKTTETWLLKIEEQGRNAALTYNELVDVFEKKLLSYLNSTRSKEDDVAKLMSSAQDLKIIYIQWTASKDAYSQLFADYEVKLKNAFNQISDASIYFKLKTSVKWFCN